MGCSVCTTPKDGIVAGCQTKGGCSSGGCSRMNVFDWFADMPISFNESFNIVEISFKKGARKGFYRNTANISMVKGQLVVVEAAQGFDVGEVSLQGELVKAQMKKRRISERDDTIRNVMRIASEQDIKILEEIRARENETLVRARAVARSMKLEMKIGDIEFQGDGKKVTIYYTADDRVDFRELVKVYARDFKVKIEMRQIGARQEAARIGGIGSCGRELCCSTWLSEFKSVNTQSVRYQNLAINTEKLSGQCGRLKCCLNYELDTYNDALRAFPRQADKLETEEGIAWLKKTEILKQLMIYEYEHARGNFIKLEIEDVKEVLWMNKGGKKPKNLTDFAVIEEAAIDESKHEDLVGQVTLATLEEKDRKKRRNHRGGKNRGGGGGSNSGQGPKNQGKPQGPNAGPKQGDGGNKRKK
ncbi:MAG: regulatory iron-sulfur-containing complex subunit RicT [Chitinophagales bacterium]